MSPTLNRLSLQMLDMSATDLPPTILFDNRTVSLAGKYTPPGGYLRIRLNSNCQLPDLRVLADLSGEVHHSLLVNQDSFGYYVTSLDRNCPEQLLTRRSCEFLQLLLCYWLTEANPQHTCEMHGSQHGKRRRFERRRLGATTPSF